MRAVHPTVIVQPDNTGLAREWAQGWNGNDFMATFRKRCQHILPRRLFDFEVVAGVRECSAQQKTWSRKRRKWIEAVVYQPAEKYGQGLWLAVGPLCPVQKMRKPILQAKPGIERVERSLAGCQDIGACRARAERGPAVLPENTAIWQENATSPVEIGALQHACGASLGIDRCEIDGVASLETMWPGHCRQGINRRSFVGQIGRAQPIGALLGDKVWIGDHAPIKKSLLHRLDA